MSKKQGRLIVERDDAGKYLLISLMALILENPSFTHRISLGLQSWGRKLGRPWHRFLIVAGLIVNAHGAMVTY